jgi:hypothetical protein
MDQPLVLGTIPWSTRGSTRKEGRNRTKKQSTQALADRPARRGGPSALATQTVRPAATDRLHPHRGMSGPTPRTVWKSNQNLQRWPWITDRPQGARGLSARHPQTVRPLPWTVRNHFQQKLKNKTDRKRSQARTRRTREEHAPRGPSAGPSRTFRSTRTEQKTARPRRSTPPNHHRISQTVEAVETRVWGLEKRHTRML